MLEQLAAVQQQMTDFQSAMYSRLDLIDAALSALDTQITEHDTGITTSIGNHNSGAASIISDHDSGIATSLSLHDASSQKQVNVETAEIDLALSDLYTLTDGHVNPDPFAITVNTCSSFRGAAHLLGALGATAKTGLNGEAGGNVFGNGGTVDVEVEGTAGLLFDIGAALDMTHQACNAGVYRPYSKAHTTGQEAAIDDYTAVAVALQNPGKLISLATEGMGLDIAVIPDALQALADAGSTPADPTALFSGTGTSSNLMDSLDIATPTHSLRPSPTHAAP